MYTHGGRGGLAKWQQIAVVHQGTLQHATMAYPPSYHPIKNISQFRSGNWMWAPPGARFNVCDHCGTHCFCDAEEGLLPRTRGAAVGAGVAAVAPMGAVAAAAAPVGGVAAAIAGGAAAPVDGVAAADNAFEGIAALFAYDSD